ETDPRLASIHKMNPGLDSLELA
ncbi:hypothetical protein A2U01_0084152, partial [Trifolium medium]|nr:hypothetical protein [Trifolium medium]